MALKSGHNCHFGKYLIKKPQEMRIFASLKVLQGILGYNYLFFNKLNKVQFATCSKQNKKVILQLDYGDEFRGECSFNFRLED
jgi:predicted amino acid racemase